MHIIFTFKQFSLTALHQVPVQKKHEMIENIFLSTFKCSAITSYTSGFITSLPFVSLRPSCCFAAATWRVINVGPKILRKRHLHCCYCYFVDPSNCTAYSIILLYRLEDSTIFGYHVGGDFICLFSAPSCTSRRMNVQPQQHNT